jgi:hypothetical protein
MVSNILHRISKKGKTHSLFRQFLSRPAGMIGLVKIGFGAITRDDNGANLFLFQLLSVIRDSCW